MGQSKIVQHKEVIVQNIIQNIGYKNVYWNLHKIQGPEGYSYSWDVGNATYLGNSFYGDGLTSFHVEVTLTNGTKYTNPGKIDNVKTIYCRINRHEGGMRWGVGTIMWATK